MRCTKKTQQQVYVEYFDKCQSLCMIATTFTTAHHANEMKKEFKEKPFSGSKLKYLHYDRELLLIIC